MAEVELFEPELDQNFTDRGWRAAFAGRTGIVCDTNGSAFGLTLPAEGSTAEIGSPSIPSRLVVDGFGLEVPAATTQSLAIPASSGGTTGRTDLIVGRLTTGPVNLELFRIQGTEGSLALPAASYNPTGTRDLLLYAIRRQQGEGLNQAIVTDLRPRIGHHYLVPAGATLPANAALGDTATRDGITWRRDMDGSSPDWVQETWPVQRLTGTDATAATVPGWGRNDECLMVRDGEGLGHRTLVYAVTRGNVAPITSDSRGSFGSSPVGVGTLHGLDRPPEGSLIPMAGRVKSAAGNLFGVSGVLGSTGAIALDATAPNLSLAEGAEVILTASWWV